MIIHPSPSLAALRDALRAAEEGHPELLRTLRAARLAVERRMGLPGETRLSRDPHRRDKVSEEGRYGHE